MDTVTHHKDLFVWRKSIALAGKVYAATRLLPSEEHSGLGQQLRRAAVCIPSSIAAGVAHRSRTECIQFLRTACGSAWEIETQILIAAAQGLITDHEALLEEIAQIGCLLNTLIRNVGSADRAAHAKACASLVGLG